jgi:hypothetical protein
MEREQEVSGLDGVIVFLACIGFWVIGIWCGRKML